MKIKKADLVFVSTVILAVCFITGCRGCKSSPIANELRFPCDQISDLTISYDDETVTFMAGNGDEVIVKEYMTVNKKNYYARVVRHDGSIHISEGGTPLVKSGFSRYVEVYLPMSYQNSLTVTTSSGEIDFSNMDINVSMIRADSTSGLIRLGRGSAQQIYLSVTSGSLDLGSVKAHEIKLETTSGNVSCDELEGNVTYTTTSGDLDLKAAIGSGTYTANNSGSLQVVYTEVRGDLYFFNKNDDIHLTIPEGLEFKFDVKTKNGSIMTDFQEYAVLDGKTAEMAVGNHPEVIITAETVNGDIKITK